jgi:acetyl esterase/lipase
VSPLYADVHDLCPAFMSVGTADHLLDDTLMLAPRWAAAGNEVELFVAPEMPHGFQAFPCGITTAWANAQFDWFARRLAV